MGGRRSLRLRLNSAKAEAEALLGLAELGNIKTNLKFFMKFYEHI